MNRSLHLNQWTYVSVCHKGRSSAQCYLISTFLICKIISLPRLVHFNTLTILHYTPAVQLLSYKYVCKKTKTMLLSTSQMSHVNSLDKNRPAITISDSTLEYVNVSKLLGVHFHQHLNWDEHVKATCKSCYGTIQIIRKLKNLAGYRLRKHLVESLVLSKLDLCDTVYYPLLEFQLKRLQCVQIVAASFVLNRYVNDINDIVKIGWLQTRSPGFVLPQCHSTRHVYFV